MQKKPTQCTETRRRFLKTSATGAAGLAMGGSLAADGAESKLAAPSRKTAPGRGSSSRCSG